MHAYSRFAGKKFKLSKIHATKSIFKVSMIKTGRKSAREPLSSFIGSLFVLEEKKGNKENKLDKGRKRTKNDWRKEEMK